MLFPRLQRWGLEYNEEARRAYDYRRNCVLGTRSAGVAGPNIQQVSLDVKKKKKLTTSAISDVRCWDAELLIDDATAEARIWIVGNPDALYAPVMGRNK